MWLFATKRQRAQLERMLMCASVLSAALGQPEIAAPLLFSARLARALRHLPVINVFQ
jgi:hypothetical protein